MSFIRGNNLEIMKSIEDASVDLILRDGPWRILKRKEMRKKKNLSAQAGGLILCLLDDSLVGRWSR